MRRLLIILAMLGLCAAPSQAKDVPASALALLGRLPIPHPRCANSLT